MAKKRKNKRHLQVQRPVNKSQPREAQRNQMLTDRKARKTKTTIAIISITVTVVATVITIAKMAGNEQQGQINNNSGVVMGDGNTVGDIVQNQVGYIDNNGNLVFGDVNIENYQHFDGVSTPSRGEQIQNYLDRMKEIRLSMECPDADCGFKGFDMRFDGDNTITHTILYRPDRDIDLESMLANDEVDSMYARHYTDGRPPVVLRIGCTELHDNIASFIPNRIMPYAVNLPQGIRLRFEAFDHELNRELGSAVIVVQREYVNE
ncbi:MAG: hypothetical protein LBC86_00170 [Oscillospiraceae bacterium]|jgi:hypothetical protein|nr:hypothetical protein [Oscillospiraceae bacterium]